MITGVSRPIRVRVEPFADADELAHRRSQHAEAATAEQRRQEARASFRHLRRAGEAGGDAAQHVGGLVRHGSCQLPGAARSGRNVGQTTQQRRDGRGHRFLRRARYPSRSRRPAFRRSRASNSAKWSIRCRWSWRIPSVRARGPATTITEAGQTRLKGARRNIGDLPEFGGQKSLFGPRSRVRQGFWGGIANQTSSRRRECPKGARGTRRGPMHSSAERFAACVVSS